MINMKAETREKMDRLAKGLVKVYGQDVYNFDNYLTLAKKVADIDGITLHYVTIKNYINYLTNRIKLQNKIVENSTTGQPEIVEPNEPIEKPHPVKMKVYFSDGSFQYFIPEPEVKPEIKQEVTKEPEPPKAQIEQSWTGLFDYNGKKVRIRRGKYKGCEITDINDVIAFFGSYKMVLGWIDYQLSPQIIEKLRFDLDTERDIKCLEDFKRFIIRKMSGQ